MIQTNQNRHFLVFGLNYLSYVTNFFIVTALLLAINISFANADTHKGITKSPDILPICSESQDEDEDENGNEDDDCISGLHSNISTKQFSVNSDNDSSNDQMGVKEFTSSFMDGVLIPSLVSEVFGIGASVAGAAVITTALAGKGSKDSSADSPENDDGGGDGGGDGDAGDGGGDAVGDGGGDAVGDSVGDGVGENIYQTTEYLTNSSAYNLIGLDEAFQNISALGEANNGGVFNFAGEGVTVAVIDSGVDLNHPSLNDNIIDECVDDCTEHYGAYDVEEHGTHVAGIIAGEKNNSVMHGVAFNATILPGCADFDDSCQPLESPSISELLSWASSHGADIANMSFGGLIEGINPETGELMVVRGYVASDVFAGGAVDYSADVLKSTNSLMMGLENSASYLDAKRAFEQGLIVVAAAANHVYPSANFVQETLQAGLQSIAPLIYADTDLASDLDKQWLAVVNVNDKLELSNSHACGDAKAFCLAAPGTNIYSTIPNNGYALKSGTSMATPMVSGSLALLLAAYPTMKLPDTDAQSDICDKGSANYNENQCLSKAAVNRLLVTTTDIGIAGVDATFGHGLLNIDAATSLIGEPQIETTSGERYNVNDSNLSLSSTMGSALAGTLAAVNFIAVDSYDHAGFIHQGLSLIGTDVSQNSRVNSMEYLNRSLKSESNSIAVSNGRLSVTQTFDKTYTSPNEIDKSYRLRYAVNDQNSLEVTTAFDADSDFSMSGTAASDVQELKISSAFNSPYSQFNNDAKGIKYQMNFGGGYTFETGVFKSGSAKDQLSGNKKLDSTSMMVQLNTPVFSDFTGRGYSASIQLGKLEEENSILGTSGSGAWDFSKGSETLITGINLDYQINSNLQLLMSYFHSTTETENGNGLIRYGDHFTSSSFSMGLLGDIGGSWQYGLFVTQPFRLSSGTATLTLPNGFNGNELSFSDYDVDLSPEGTHLEYELAVSWKPAFLDYMRLNLLRINDYGNISGNNDSLVLLSGGLDF